MKKNIITAAFAAASALLLVSSCAKEELRENVNTEDGKVFTAVINQDLTKTTITSEYKVNWVEGDQIDINGSIFSATPDASDATKATFTKVSGSDPDGTFGYTAVYPASIMVATQATLPATQTYAAGEFNAPMCAMSETESLEFKNFCGVLCFALKGTDKVKSIAVTANEQLCGPFEFSDDATFGCFSGENVGYTVTLNCGEGVQLDASTATSFYISLPPATYTAGMKIVVTSTEGKTFEKTTTKSAAIARNQIYTFNWTASFSPAEPDCVEIGGIKWATMNLGATTVAGSYTTCYGDLYQWGSVKTLYNGFTLTSATEGSFTWKSGKKNGFVTAYREYTGNDATLPDANDVVKQTYPGTNWRMPTSAEFQALYDACLNGSYDKTTNPSGASASVGKGVYWCTSYDGVAGLLFCDGFNKLFFPAAGYGTGTNLNMAGSYGIYWSSSLDTSSTAKAYRLSFYSGNVTQNSNDRYYGYSVRPVKDAAPTTTGTAKATIGGSQVDVNWVQLWENGPKFAEYNVGNSNAEDYGGYYTWGGTYKNGQSITWSDDHNTGDNVLSGDNDTATKLWGSNWRMPTKAELEALLNSTNCDVAWTDNYNGTGIKGRIYTGKGAYASNSVFLPAAGNCSDGSVGSQGSKGFYRSSTPYDSNKAYSLYFTSSSQKVYYYSRITGYSVRAVLAE